MPRPRIYNNLKNTTVTVEAELLDRARVMSINISDTLREALISKISDPKSKEVTIKFAKIPSFELRKVRKFVMGNPEKAGFWSEWLNKKYSTELTADDIIERLAI